VSPTPLSRYPGAQVYLAVGEYWNRPELRFLRPFALHAMQHIEIWTEIEIIQARIVAAAMKADHRLFIEHWLEDIRNPRTRYNVMARTLRAERPKDAKLLLAVWDQFVAPTGEVRDNYAHSVWAISSHAKLKHRLVLIPQKTAQRRDAAHDEIDRAANERKQPGKIETLPTTPYDADATQAYTIRDVRGNLRVAREALIDAHKVLGLAYTPVEKQGPASSLTRAALTVRAFGRPGQSSGGGR
jgi:hypothetical protein